MKIAIKAKIYFITLAALAVLPAGVVRAGTIADIVFEKKPMFSEANILPGDSVTRWLKITSLSANTLYPAIKAVSVSDPDNIGDRLELILTSGGTELYRKELSIFLDSGVFSLPPLAPGASVQYDLKITFDQDAGNEFQLASLAFDIVVNVEDRSESLPTGGGSYAISSVSASSQPPVSVSPIRVLGESGQPELQVAKTALKTSANPGDADIGYAITVRNTGNMTAYAATLADELPELMYFIENKNRSKSVELGDIDPGEERTMQFLAGVEKDAPAGSYENRVTVQALNHEPVSASAPISIRPVTVAGVEFAPTGFDPYEFALIILFIALAKLFVIKIKNLKS